jgi:hypothetical protein
MGQAKLGLGIIVLVSAHGCANVHRGRPSTTPGAEAVEEPSGPSQQSTYRGGTTDVWSIGSRPNGQDTGSSAAATAAGVSTKPQESTPTDELVFSTLACALGPTIWDRAGESSSEYGANGPACLTMSHAVLVAPDALYALDPATVDSVRAFLGRRLAAEASSAEVASNTLALFDRGVEAAREAKAAREAIINRRQGVTSADPRWMAAHGHLDALVRLSTTLVPTSLRSGGLALAWLIAANRFLGMQGLPEEEKVLPAEPLFTLMGVDTTGWRRNEPGVPVPPSAVGGGPELDERARGGAQMLDSSGRLSTIVENVEAELQSLEEQVPYPQLTRAMDDTMERLRKFAGASSPH